MGKEKLNEIEKKGLCDWKKSQIEIFLMGLSTISMLERCGMFNNYTKEILRMKISISQDFRNSLQKNTHQQMGLTKP